MVSIALYGIISTMHLITTHKVKYCVCRRTLYLPPTTSQRLTKLPLRSQDGLLYKILISIKITKKHKERIHIYIDSHKPTVFHLMCTFSSSSSSCFQDEYVEIYMSIVYKRSSISSNARRRNTWILI